MPFHVEVTHTLNRFMRLKEDFRFAEPLGGEQIGVQAGLWETGEEAEQRGCGRKWKQRWRSRDF